MPAEFYDYYTASTVDGDDLKAVTDLRIRTALRKSNFEFAHPQAQKYPSDLQAALDFLRNVGHPLTRADEGVKPRPR